MLIILQSDPRLNHDYEQGIELAISYGDLVEANDITVLVAGAFLQELVHAHGDEVFVKKLKQLELFEVEAVALEHTPCAFVKRVNKSAVRALVASKQRVLSF